MLNILLPKNFNSPFKSESLIDFWRRWHITLSNFLTNFIYNPWLRSLKKITFFKSMILIFVVFFLAGLWHGPSWTFIIFGIIHGIGLIVNHLIKKFTFVNINKFINIFITFNYVNISFIFFRSNTIQDSLNVLKAMAGMNGLYFYDIEKIFLFNNSDKIYYLLYIIIFTLSFFVCFLFKNTYSIINEYKKIK
jgi:D-alanyl-lipoteichoic acid acyltransferase DltB (MBOAT superfamily)